MFNPVIILAIIVQALVAKASRIAGAVIGYVITTGILLWGISVYGQGDQIALFAMPLPQPVFLIACLVWYGFDTREFMAAKNEASAMGQVLESPLVREERVRRFYRATLEAWYGGRLSKLNRGFESKGRMQLEELIKKYPPYAGSALRALFEQFPPLPGEFLIGLGNLQAGSDPGWFVLTNFRLIQRDGRDNLFDEVLLAEVDTFEIKGAATKTLDFEMKSGQKMAFEKVLMHPSDKYLFYAIEQPLDHLLDARQIRELRQAGATPQARQIPAIRPVEDLVALGKQRIAGQLCPKCGSPVAPSDSNCPSCQVNLAFAREHLGQL
jgi:hypothetical protein